MVVKEFCKSVKALETGRFKIIYLRDSQSVYDSSQFVFY